MCLFYLYANAKIEIHICSNKHETGLVDLCMRDKKESAVVLPIVVETTHFMKESCE